MDAVGRKASLLAFSVMSLFIGWTLLMAASQVWQLYTGRFLLGLGAGMEITICPVYIQEICRPPLRDVCGSFPQVIFGWSGASEARSAKTTILCVGAAEHK
jgi:MFS family permease